jgi:galactokinase/mevalonate kinase-like predicted kinase
VILVIDQFRADYLERLRDRFGDGGFRLFLERGAYFPDCNYDYANTRTAPGHATLVTGAYSNGHGIVANEWWDPKKKKIVSSVEDDTTRLIGLAGHDIGASPKNLLASTLGDELKLATQGKARVFGLALKDRAAILPAGRAADGAYWIEHNSGAWVTSTYYRSELPKWVADFNASNRSGKYWEREWTDANGVTLGSTAHRKLKDGSEAPFYDVVGSTPFANDYELEFARELVLYEHLGTGPATDLLTISLSANDIVGHEFGPDSPQVESMVLNTDRQLADFFTFLGHQVGLANTWIVLSADHGVAPLPSVALQLRLPGANLKAGRLNSEIQKALVARLRPGHQVAFVEDLDYPTAWLNDEAFSALKIKEADAERAVGEAMKLTGVSGPYLEIVSLSDIPAGTGLGSSGSFTTALLCALHALNQKTVSPQELAEQACHIEIDILKEPVGKQDQYIAAFGGIAALEFLPDDRVLVQPLQIPAETLANLEDGLLLFFTGNSRSASEILRHQDAQSKNDSQEMLANLHFTKQLGIESREALLAGDLRQFARLMARHWEHKKRRSPGMSNGPIDQLYELASANGALGGKLVGAGGGGFLMLYTEEKVRLRRAMREAGLREVRLRFDFGGTTVLARS